MLESSLFAAGALAFIVWVAAIHIWRENGEQYQVDVGIINASLGIVNKQWFLQRAQRRRNQRHWAVGGAIVFTLPLVFLLVKLAM